MSRRLLRNGWGVVQASRSRKENYVHSLLEPASLTHSYAWYSVASEMERPYPRQAPNPSVSLMGETSEPEARACTVKSALLFSELLIRPTAQVSIGWDRIPSSSIMIAMVQNAKVTPTDKTKRMRQLKRAMKVTTRVRRSGNLRSATSIASTVRLTRASKRNPDSRLMVWRCSSLMSERN